MRWFLFGVLVLLVGETFLSAEAWADKKDPDKTEKNDAKDSPLFVVPPTGGKEVKLTQWRFILGTRHLSLPGDPPVKSQPEKPTGLEYLEFREDKSTTYQNGILTLVPLTSIRKIDYDHKMKRVALAVVNADGKEETLTGSTKFVGINKVGLEAETVLEGLGAATVKFQGGSDKGVHSIRFPSPKPAVEAKGIASAIIAVDKTKHTVQTLQPLYLIEGNYRVLPYLMFKKTLKLDMDKIVSMRFVPSEDKKISHDFEVTLKGGAKNTLMLLTKIEADKDKSATLEGLIGRVPSGYKLFPVHTIQELQTTLEDDKKGS